MLLERTRKRDALFWDKVDVRSGDDECWPWTGATNDKGYGVITATIDGKQHRYYAHKVSYEWENGELPDREIVRHRCDNPPCVRPSHLLSGTHKQNMQDMVDRGRHVGSRTIEEADVVAMRTERAAGTDPKDLAARYSMHEKHIVAICSGRFWPNAGGPIVKRGILTDAAIRAVTSDRGSMTQKACAEKHGLSKAAVQQIWSGFRREKGEG